MSLYTNGIDISTYQDSSSTPIRIDFTKPKQPPHNVKFIINRVTFVASKDDDFDHNWQQEKLNNYIRGVYGFWGYWPGCADVSIQAKTLVSILKPDHGEFPVVWLDVEKANNSYPVLPPRSVSLPSIERYLKTVEDGLGMKTGMYTNIAGLVALAPIPDWLMERPLWIAWPLFPNTGETVEAFVERTGVTPPISRYWSNPFTLWQYSWKGPGIEMGMESYGLDMDYFNGGEEELLRFCGIGDDTNPEPDPDEPPQPPQPETEEYHMKMQVLVPVLNVRYGPGTNYPVIGSKKLGETIEVHNISCSSNGLWVQISEKAEWCCSKSSGGIEYLQKI